MITRIEDRIEVDLKIINVETGKIAFSDYDQIIKPKHLRFLSDDILYKILNFLIEQEG